MSREIKFRQLVNGNWWHFGWLEKNVFTGPPKTNREKYPTVQCTGLKDKNGVCIYEGDVISAIPICDGDFNPWIDYVEYSPDKSAYVCDEENIGYYESFELEVIGNIHQHPELLEK